MHSHLMIDCETLGLIPGDAVVQIAVLEFDPYLPLEFGRSAVWYVSLYQSIRNDRIDADTLRWWMSQSEAARRRVFGAEGAEKPTYTILADMHDFWSTLPGGAHTPLWAHGAAFDTPMIQAVLSGPTRAKMPWDYHALRDTRTLYDLVGGAPEALVRGVPHDAVDDCRAQATQVQQAFLQLRNLLPEIADASSPAPVRGTHLGTFAEAVGGFVRD
jgi:hypothetical protein